MKHPIQEATKVGKDLVQDASPLLKSTPDVDDTIILIIEDNPEMRVYIRGIDLVQDASPLLKSTPDIDDTIILIIEDNPEMRFYIREHLERDYKVLEAEDW